MQRIILGTRWTKPATGDPFGILAQALKGEGFGMTEYDLVRACEAYDDLASPLNLIGPLTEDDLPRIRASFQYVS